MQNPWRGKIPRLDYDSCFPRVLTQHLHPLLSWDVSWVNLACLWWYYRSVCFSCQTPSIWMWGRRSFEVLRDWMLCCMTNPVLQQCFYLTRRQLLFWRMEKKTAANSQCSSPAYQTVDKQCTKLKSWVARMQEKQVIQSSIVCAWTKKLDHENQFDFEYFQRSQQPAGNSSNVYLRGIIGPADVEKQTWTGLPSTRRKHLF